MTPLWSAQALVDAVGGRPIGVLPETVGGISIDSRSLQPGDVFFAIKGERMDGHDFVTAAIKAGAGLLVVAEERLAGLGRHTAPMVVVPDVLAALGRLAVAARERSRARIIAVTGSAGKTTTKEALRHALAPVGKVHASDKSFNNHWGVPLTLARLPAEADFAVFEIGMNHEGEIRPLVGMVRPHVAIVTLIAAAHLGHFNSLDDIARAKAEIFEGVASGGAALINRDDERFGLLERLARAAGVERVLGFGGDEAADYRLLACTLDGDGSTVEVDAAGERLTARIGAPGRHIVQNALAVIGAAHLAGADLGAVAAALAGLRPEKGRGARHLLGDAERPIVLIDESYNANPASMRAAIALLDATPTSGEGRRIAVLGDMLELGTHSQALHSGLAEVIAGTATDLVFLAGREMKVLAERLPSGIRAEYREGVDELQPLLLGELRPGDAVMIKSSNGVGFSRLVDAVIKAFPSQSDTKAG